MELHNYRKFSRVNEERKEKVCRIFDLNDVRNTPTYKDLISIGYKEEFLPEPRPGAGKSNQRELQGNMAFSHKTKTGASGYPQFMIKGDKSGMMRVLLSMKMTSTGAQEDTEPFWIPQLKDKTTGALYTGTSPKSNFGAKHLLVPYEHRLSQRCMTVEDYEFKMSYIIKWTLGTEISGMGFRNDDYLSSEGYKEAIGRKIGETPRLIQNSRLMDLLPASLSGEGLAQAIIDINDLKLFTTIKEKHPELWKEVERLMGGSDTADLASDLGSLGF
jgi:hypothetical protein